MHGGKHGVVDEFDEMLELFVDDEIGKQSWKKGCIALKKNNFLKVTYAHRNAEMEGIGVTSSNGSAAPGSRLSASILTRCR